MPFCTACGKQNPDDARFCQQCGTRVVAADPNPVSDSTATIQIAGGDKVETSDRALSPVDAAAVDALPSGHALLV
ncbi:MAG: zinc ribbon domain-containing protein, partial [Nocardioidaceae bacterium]|nr:zinc ribbon domain-containing protein [Nocardioidaceae bacterium]